MLDKSKCDPELGQRIHQHLKDQKIETPTLPDRLAVPAQKKIDQIIELEREKMRILGLDQSDESLIETPKRVAKMFVNELFWGLHPENFPKCTTIPNDGINYDEMLVVNDARVMSVCEHHFVTIDGLATVAYIPHKKVLGLSKINRIIEYFSHRPQVQERLSHQIHAALTYILETPDVAVNIRAVHYCVKSRGVADANSYTVTNKLGGAFRDASMPCRSEFLALVSQRTSGL